MEHISISMGEIIREMRKSKGLTQEALAQAMGVSIQAVSKWETGQSLPDVTLLPVIADYFSISVDALFGREAERAQESHEAAQTEPVQAAAPPLFPDDNKLRVVQYLGSRMMSAEECADGKDIRLLIDESKARTESGVKSEIEIQGSARINGSVNGALKTLGDAYISGSINGAATAEGDITCNGNINGSARAGGAVNGRGTAATIHMETMDESHSGLKISLAGLGNMVSSMFGNRRTGNAVGANMNAFFRGELPDDDVIRVVQLQGRRIMSAEESSGQKIIRLSVEHITDPLNVEIYGSAQIAGDIHGNATSGDSLACGKVEGNASAGDSLNCGDIAGNASAGDGVRCGNVGGNVTAGDGVTCGTVGGNVRAGDSAHVTGDVGGNVTASDSVTCGNIQGDVKADSVKCGGMKRQDKSMDRAASSAQSMPDIQGFTNGALHVVQLMNGKILSAEESRGKRAISLCLEDADGITVHVHGDAQIEGDIEGDVRADGSVTCGSVEGDVHAGAQVNCESVEGDVHAGAQVNCENVEGDVSAGAHVNCETVEGDVTAGVSVTCGSVEGNVSVQGSSDKCSVSCEGVECDVNVINASLTCSGVISGNVEIRGDEPNACSVCCEGVEGDVDVINASVSCKGVINGNVDIRCDEPYACSVVCEGVEGDVTAINASVTCEGGVISGNVDIRCEQPYVCSVVCEGVEGDVTARNASVICSGVVGGDIDAECEADEE